MCLWGKGSVLSDVDTSVPAGGQGPGPPEAALSTWLYLSAVGDNHTGDRQWPVNPSDFAPGELWFLSHSFLCSGQWEQLPLHPHLHPTPKLGVSSLVKYREPCLLLSPSWETKGWGVGGHSIDGRSLSSAELSTETCDSLPLQSLLRPSPSPF